MRQTSVKVPAPHADRIDVQFGNVDVAGAQAFGRQLAWIGTGAAVAGCCGVSPQKGSTETKGSGAGEGFPLPGKFRMNGTSALPETARIGYACSDGGE